MKILYLVGIPGAGKTTALAAAVDRVFRDPVAHDRPIPHISYNDGAAIQLGRDRGTFSGTDALSMSISPAACEFVRTEPTTVMFAEGDRLANRPFFETAASVAETFAVAFLPTPVTVAMERAAQRAARNGHPPQSDSWWKGRVTKVRRLTDEWSDHLLVLDPENAADDLATVLAMMMTRETPQFTD